MPDKKIESAYEVQELVWVNGPYGVRESTGELVTLDLTGPAIVIKISQPEKLPAKIRKHFAKEKNAILVMGLCQTFLSITQEARRTHNHRECHGCRQLKATGYPLWVHEESIGGSLFQPRAV